MSADQPKIALITGGSRGLGRNTAISLARRGVDIILTYNTNRAEAVSAMEEIAGLGRHGVPDDIGPMIAALLSDDNRWVNAQRIEASGGAFL